MAEPPPFLEYDLENASAEVKHYQRGKQLAVLLALSVTLVYLAVTGLLAGPVIDRALRNWVGDQSWLRLVLLALLYAVGLEAVTLPIDWWSELVLEHRHQLSKQTLAGWLWKRVKGWLVGGPIGLVLLLGLYALLWHGGRWWWVGAALGFLLVTLVLGRLLPTVILPLFYRVDRLEDAALLERLQRLAEGTGLTVEGIYRLALSDETRKANAALAGLGRSRRVLLGDTLLDAFTPEEIEVVFAHEVGHHVHRHLIKLLALAVVLTAAGLWLADLVLRHAAGPLGYAAFDDPGAMPLLLLVLMVFSLVLTPAENLLGRWFERQCDRYALERTGRPDAYRSAFCKLARMNKADPDPHPLVVWLLYDHPPIRERLAMAHGLPAAGAGGIMQSNS